jgi:hypothetical protein
MAYYAFFNPVRPGKVADWKRYISEMTGPRKADMAATRRKAGLNQERVWLQAMPAGDFAVVFWDADDVGKVFQHFMSSNDPFDVWFRDKILVEVHGMSPTAPPPPMNEAILNYPD